MDKSRFFSAFSIIAFGSRETLRHLVAPLVGATVGLESLSAKPEQAPVDASSDIFEKLDFDVYENTRLGYHSLGVSLIICFSELIKHIANNRGSANGHFGLKKQNDFEFHRLGPKIGSVFYWAEGVVSAGNYVRHDDEWQKLINPITKKADGVDFNISYDGVNWIEEVAKFDDRTKKNVTIINGIGVKFETFLRHNSMAGHEIALALSLFEMDQALRFFDEWVTAVVRELEQALDINDLS